MNPVIKWASAAAATVFLASIAQARFIVADYAGKGIAPNKNTHVIVAARGTDMGLQFHMSAAAHARKIMDVNPNDQVVLVSVMEPTMSEQEAAKYSQEGVNAEGEDYNRLLVHRQLKRHKAASIEELLQRWGFTQFENHDVDLETKTLVALVERFSRVASLNVYAHSTTFYGLIMDGPFNRIDPHEDMSSLRDNFIPGAYAWFHGCNTGQKIVRTLSESWGIPIAGSYTSTAFQELYFDNTPEQVNFYHGYPGNPPKTLREGKMVERRIGVNRLSFKKSHTCEKVPCVRMMPDNGGYFGYWGSYREGGLGFYRFSCSSKSVPNKDVCFSTMARAMINQISHVYTDMDTNLETFKKAVANHLCPAGERKVQAGYKYEKCAADLEASLTNPNITVDTFWGKSLNCGWDGNCNFSYKCMESAITPIFGSQYRLLKPGSCSIVNKKDPNAPNRTMVDEYAKYVKGFEILQRNKR